MITYYNNSKKGIFKVYVKDGKYISTQGYETENVVFDVIGEDKHHFYFKKKDGNIDTIHRSYLIAFTSVQLNLF